jgi:hypothetical protein
MSGSASNVVQFADHREPPQKSQYDLYLLPFFAAGCHSTWAVKPTGDYCKDCETGRRYAIEFLRSCDGTLGWSTLLTQVVGDMIRAGPDGNWPSGRAKINGIVVGFMGTIGKTLTSVYARRS